MAKFYVRSNKFQGVVESFDAECAAVWAVNRVMDRHQRLDLNEDDVCADVSADIGLFALDDEITVSERGFRGADAVSIPTHHAFLRWIQLVNAVNALSTKLDDLFEDIA